MASNLFSSLSKTITKKLEQAARTTVAVQRIGEESSEEILSEARNFLSKSGSSVKIEDITKLFETLTMFSVNNETVAELIKGKFATGFVDRIRSFGKSTRKGSDSEVPRMLVEVTYLLLKKSLDVSSQIHQELVKNGLFPSLSKLIDSCPVEEAVILVGVLKKIVVLLHERYDSNMHFESQLQCLKVLADLIHMSRESRKLPEIDQVHLEILNTVLSIYNRFPSLCVGIEDSIKFIPNFIAIQNFSKSLELRIMCFKSIEILATALDYFHGGAIRDGGMLVRNLFQTANADYLKDGTFEKEKMDTILNILSYYKSLLKHLVEYNFKYLNDLGNLRIVQESVVPLLKLSWRRTTGDAGNEPEGSFSENILPFLDTAYRSIFEIMKLFFGDPNIVKTLVSAESMLMFKRLICRTEGDEEQLVPESCLAMAVDVMEALAKQSNRGLETVMKFFLKILKTKSDDVVLLTFLVLKSVGNIMSMTTRGRTVFRTSYGFEVTFSILSSRVSHFTDHMEGQIDSENVWVDTIVHAVDTFTRAMEGPHAANRKYFRDKIGYKNLHTTLEVSKIIESEYALHVLNSLLKMFSGNLDNPVELIEAVELADHESSDRIHKTSSLKDKSCFQKSKVAMQMNCSSLVTIFYSLLSVKPSSLAVHMMQCVNLSLFGAGPLCSEMAAESGNVSLALDILSKLPISDSNAPLVVEELSSFLKEVSKKGLRVYELRYVLRLLYRECDTLLSGQEIEKFSIQSSLPMLRLLKDLSDNENMENVPFITLGQTDGDSYPAYGVVTNFGGWAWPPSNGLSFSCWLKISSSAKQAAAESEICLLEVHDGQNHTAFGIYLGKDGITFGTGPKDQEDTVYFRHGCDLFESKEWHHIVLVHQRTSKSRPLFFSRSGMVHLYIDGRKVGESQPLAFSNTFSKGGKVGLLYAVIGNASESSNVWYLGPCMFTLEALSLQNALRIYLAGPYCEHCFRSVSDTIRDADILAGLLRLFQGRSKACNEALSDLGFASDSSTEDTLAELRQLQEMTLNCDNIQFFFVASQSKRVDMSGADGMGVIQSFVVSNMAIDCYGIRQSNAVLQLKGSAYPTTEKALISSLQGVGGVLTMYPVLDKVVNHRGRSVPDCDSVIVEVVRLLSNLMQSRLSSHTFSDLTDHNGYAILAFLMSTASQNNLFTPNVVTAIFESCVGIDGAKQKIHGIVSHIGIFKAVLLNVSIYYGRSNYSEVRRSLLDLLLRLIHSENTYGINGNKLVPANPHASYNRRRLREIDILKWVLISSFRDAQSLGMRKVSQESRDTILQSFVITEDILFELLRDGMAKLEDINSIAEFLLASVKNIGIATPAKDDSKLFEGYEHFQQSLLRVLLRISKQAGMSDNSQKSNEKNLKSTNRALLSAKPSFSSLSNLDDESEFSRLQSLYKVTFFEKQPMLFICLMDRLSSSQTVGLALKLLFETVQCLNNPQSILNESFFSLYENSLCYHHSCTEIYVLLISLLVGAPVNKLPESWYDCYYPEDTNLDAPTIINAIKDAIAQSALPISAPDEKTAGGILGVIKNMMSESIRRSTFCFTGTDAFENDESIFPKELSPSLQQDGTAPILVDVFLTLAKDGEDFRFRCASPEYMSQFVRMIFCCASHNAAKIMRSESDKSQEGWAENIEETYMTLENESKWGRTSDIASDAGNLKKLSRPSSSNFVDNPAIMKGELVSSLFELIGTISESFILGDFTGTKDFLLTEAGEGAKVCIQIMESFPSYAPLDYVFEYQKHVLKLLHLRLGQTLRSLRFDWLHNVWFGVNMEMLCRDLLRKSIDGWYAGSEVLVLSFMLDCLSCTQGLSGVQKIDVQRREKMLYSVSTIVYNFICYSINECSIQIKEGNYEYNGTLSDILALVAENGRWLFVVTLGSEREPTRRKAPTSTIKNFMSGKALASQFSVTEFLSCVCYLTVDLFHDTYTREVNNATLQFWKSMFQFRQIEVMGLLEAQKLGTGTEEPVARGDGIYSDGFHLILKEGDSEPFLKWFLASEDEVKQVIERTSGKAWRLREKFLTSSRMAWERQIEVIQVEKLKKLKVGSKGTKRGQIPVLCKHAIQLCSKGVSKQLKDFLSAWSYILERGKECWGQYKLMMKNTRSPLDRVSSLAERWQLDFSECYSRMRRKLKKNELFYEVYGIEEKQEALPDSAVPKRTEENEVMDTPKKVRRLSSLIKENDNVDSPFTRGRNAVAAIPQIARKKTSNGALTESEDGHDSALNEDAELEEEDNFHDDEYHIDDKMREKLLKSSKYINHQEKQKILYTANCTVVRGLEAIEAIFFLTDDAMHIAEGYQKDEQGVLIEVGEDIFKWEYTVTLLDTSKKKVNAISKKKRKQYKVPKSKPIRYHLPFEEVKGFYTRRYLLRNVGIELYDLDGGSVLIAFQTKKIQAMVHKKISSLNLPNCDFKKKIDKIDENQSASNGPKSDSARHRNAYLTLMMKKWTAGEISNFEYLMILNTFAGRSYNDLTQYPVFPWVLADYESDTIDLAAEKSYRDLSKPMGALGADRAELFTQRYEEVKSFNDPMTPAFHYGTHYSTSAYVLYYLLRLEPFSQMAVDLQNGKFDHPERLFSSVNKSWTVASGTKGNSLQDVRELTPEFFYNGEFLKNSNRFDLGKLGDNKQIDDVVLPPWCDGDPKQFVRINRKALESEYVSRNLHHWIDLIFGFKQTGPEAEKALNIFHPFTYEGEVDVDAIQDAAQRDSVMAQIHNFGQTPSQLFTRPHPTKKVNTVNLLDTEEDALKAMRWHKHLSGPLVLPGVTPTKVCLQYKSIEDDSVLQKASQVLKSLMTNNVNLGPVGDIRILSGKRVMYVRSMTEGVGGSSNTDKARYGAILHPPTYRKYLTWGHPDGSVQIHTKVVTPRHREIGRVVAAHDSLHDGIVSCAAFSDDGRILVTGGEDTNGAIWYVLKEGRRALRLKGRLCGHERAITCVSICTTNGIIVTGSNDCSAIVWDISESKFVRLLEGHESAIRSVSINRKSGNILTANSASVRLWGINGNLLAAVAMRHVELSPISYATVTACEDWQDGIDVVTGHEDGTVALWSLRHKSDKLVSSLRENNPMSISADESEADISPVPNRSAASSSVSSLGSVGSTAQRKDRRRSFYALLGETRKLETASLLLSKHQKVRPTLQVRVSVETVRSVLTMEQLLKSSEEGKKFEPNWRLVLNTVYKAHNGRVTAIRVSKDQLQMVTGDSRGQIYWWHSVLEKAMEDNEILTPLQDMF